MRAKPPYFFGDEGLGREEYAAVLKLFFRNRTNVPRESPDLIFTNLAQRFGKARVSHAVNTLRGYGQDAKQGHCDSNDFTYERITKTDVALRPA